MVVAATTAPVSASTGNDSLWLNRLRPVISSTNAVTVFNEIRFILADPDLLPFEGAASEEAPPPSSVSPSAELVSALRASLTPVDPEVLGDVALATRWNRLVVSAEYVGLVQDLSTTLADPLVATNFDDFVKSRTASGSPAGCIAALLALAVAVGDAIGNLPDCNMNVGCIMLKMGAIWAALAAVVDQCGGSTGQQPPGTYPWTKPSIDPEWQQVDPYTCHGEYTVIVPYHPLEDTSFVMDYGDGSTQQHSIQRGVGWATYSLGHDFPYVPGSTWTQRATLYNGNYDESYSYHP